MLVVDIETGDFEMDDDDLAATMRAHAKHPGGAFFGIRVGYTHADCLSGGWQRDEPGSDDAQWPGEAARKESKVMGGGHPRFHTHEICERGMAIYEQQLRSKLGTEENTGKFLIIDIETGDYEM